MGDYADLQKRYKKVKSAYVLNKTKYFDLPSSSVSNQLEELVKNKQSIGLISYCKVKEHKEDPIVEITNEFVMIEDIFTVNNKWVQEHPMSQYNVQSMGQAWGISGTTCSFYLYLYMDNLRLGFYSDRQYLDNDFCFLYYFCNVYL